jgi:hypothetical protein
MPGVEHVIEYHVLTAGSCWGGIVDETPVRLETGDVILERNAESVLGMFTQDITQSISFIASTTVTVTHTPTGRIDLTVSGELAASL